MEDIKGTDRDSRVLEKSKDKLKRDTEKAIADFFEQVLDIGEVAIGDSERYKAFRRQVLRAGNDAIRDIKKFLDRDYQVLYVPTTEDVVEVQVPTVQPRKVARNS